MNRQGAQVNSSPEGICRSTAIIREELVASRQIRDDTRYNYEEGRSRFPVNKGGNAGEYLSSLMD